MMMSAYILQLHICVQSLKLSQNYFFFLYLELTYNINSELIISSKTAFPCKVRFCVKDGLPIKYT